MNNKSDWKIFNLGTIDSTNEAAKKMARDYNGKFIVTADSQTNGKGQFGRRWLAPPKKNLTATFVMQEDDVNAARLLSLAAGVAVATLLEDFGLTPACKWPNDIIIGNHKIAGILIEKINDKILTGIGVNINWPAKKTILENNKKCTSVLAETGRQINIDKIILALALSLEKYYNKEEEKILKIYKKFWNKNLKTEILTDDNFWTRGNLIDISPEGALIAKAADNITYKITTSARIKTDDSEY